MSYTRTKSPQAKMRTRSLKANAVVRLSREANSNTRGCNRLATRSVAAATKPLSPGINNKTAIPHIIMQALRAATQGLCPAQGPFPDPPPGRALSSRQRLLAALGNVEVFVAASDLAPDRCARTAVVRHLLRYV
jgi:hypothetical protein